MVWAHVYVDRIITKKMLLTKPREREEIKERPRWLDQIMGDVEDKRSKWTEIHTTKTWEDRECWRSRL